MENDKEKNLYLNKIFPYFAVREREEIATAYDFSKYGHVNQKRDDGTPYVNHPREVALIIVRDFNIKFDWHVIVIALLHDIVEDQNILTERRIWINFKDQVTQGVKFVSKDDTSRSVFFPRLFDCNQWRPMVVKLADRIHNLRTLEKCTLEKQIFQVEETREYYFKLCDIAEKTIPKRYRPAITYAREELSKLCVCYEKKNS